MVGMLVGDEDSIQLIESYFDSSQSRERFAFAEAAVHKEAGALRFEQCDVARTTRSQDGNAQAYRSFSKNPRGQYLQTLPPHEFLG